MCEALRKLMKDEIDAKVSAAEAKGEAKGKLEGRLEQKIQSAKDLIKAGLLTIEALQTSGLYTSEEIAAIKA